MRTKLTIAEVEELYSEAKGFQPDGCTDFDRMAEIIGLREADLVWACVNAYKRPSARVADSARTAKLRALVRSKS